MIRTARVAISANPNSRSFAKFATKILLAQNYYDSWQYIPVLALATAFSALVTFMASVYMVRKRSVNSFVTAAVGAVTNIALNLLLIPRFSATGAAVATFFSYFIVFIIRAVDSRKMIPFRLGIPKLIFNTVAISVQCVAMISEMPYWIPIQIVILGAVFAVNGKDMVKGILLALRNKLKKA